MKIAYLLNYSIAKEDGVTRKISTQIAEWKECGHEVIAVNMFEVVKDPQVDACQYYCGNWFQKKFKVCTQIIDDIESFKPDILYFRFTYWNRTLGLLQNKFNNIIELNSNDVDEVKLNFRDKPSVKRAVRVILNHLLRGPVLANASGFVSVTNELKEKTAFRKFRKKTIVCPNSYNVSAETFRKKVYNSDHRTALFFIGSPGQAWHGVDYISNLASSLKQYDFHIVGDSGKNTENLFYHGFLKKEEYQKILEECSICIGSLAAYRKNLEEGSPLKVREYIACGFPVILGNKDTAFIDLPEDPKWILRLDFRLGVDIDKLIAFIENLKNYCVDMEEAKKIIDSGMIEKRRLDFFEEIIECQE